MLRGNIDLRSRPEVRNPHGGISTVLSMSIGTNRGEVLIPRVVAGRILSPQAAIAAYRRSGQNLGVFRSAEDANIYADRLHRFYAHQPYDFYPYMPGYQPGPSLRDRRFINV
jgi:hypothetical protein